MLSQVLDLIKSSIIKSRTEGLTNLRQIFRSNGHSHKLETLSDTQQHAIFEALFECAVTDRSQYLKANREVLKKSAASRLTLCASTLRTAVEVTKRNLGISILNALLEHITQTLEQPDHGLCEPLADDYSKILRTVLEDGSYVEHFRPRADAPGKWKDVAAFCLEVVRLYTNNIDPTASIISNGHSPANTQSNIGRAGRSFASQTGTRTSTASSPCFEFIACIRKLVEATNAPVGTFAGEILSTLTEFLRSTPTIGRGHLDAFAAINHVLGRIINSFSDIMRQQTRELLPLIKECWSSKRSSLKEELMTTLMLITPYISAMLRDNKAAELEDDVESLLEMIMTEYTRRHEKDLLHVEDLKFLYERTDDLSNSSLPSTFDLKGGNEGNFTVVYLMASLSSVIDLAKRHRVQRAYQDNVDQGPNKRARQSSFLEDYTRRLAYSSSIERLCILQTLSLYVTMVPLNENDISETISRMINQLGDPQPAISSWALLSLSNCVMHRTSSAAVLTELWTTVWQAAMRYVPVSSTSRAACHLLNILLRRGVVEYSSVSGSVDTIFSDANVNGPAVLCESSLSLWIAMMNKRLIENPSSGGTMVNRMLQWLFAKWTPSE